MTDSIRTGYLGLSAAALSATANGTTLGDRLAPVAAFAMPADIGADLTPLTDAARSLLAGDAALAPRLVAIADLIREAPSAAGGVQTLVLAPDVEGLAAARAAARLLVLPAAPTREQAKDELFRMSVGASRFTEGEFVPAARQLLLGPIASAGLLGRLATAEPAIVTHSAYVTAHEIAHARQPIAADEVQDQAIREAEEARADLVTRWSDLPERVAATFGARVDRTTLGADDTYHDLRARLEQDLAGRGVQPGSAGAAWLDARRAAELV